MTPRPLRAALPLLPLFALVAQPAGQPAGEASIAIDARTVVNRISPKLYGHFAEFMFEGVKFGMHAELLRNRGFEETANAIGLSRHWERSPDDRNDDVAMRIRWDDSVAYPPSRPYPRESTDHSQRIDLLARDGQLRGIHQNRIPLRAGVEYRGSFWLRSHDFEGRVMAALEQDRTGGEMYASAEVGPITADGEWRQYRFTLKPGVSDPLGRLAVLFDGKGRVWLDQVSLMPGDAVADVRADVYERIKALRPAFIRWPGGNVAQDYHWIWGVGPRDQRPEWINLAWWNEREPSDFGTLEFLRFCQTLPAEPHLVVNVEGRGATAEEAAAWVEYVNGAATTKYGALRASHGAPEPFGVETWEIGNEIWGPWVRGHSDADTYARNYRRYRAAMAAVDPTIRFIAVGDNDMEWNRTVLKHAGGEIDFLAIHHYYGTLEKEREFANLMARPLFYERFYQDVAKEIRSLAPGRNIRLVINEWNTALPVPRQHSMESALYGARLMNVFERSGDIVEMTAVSDLVNGWPGGVIQASRHDVFVTPTYHAIRLYNDFLGQERLAAEVTSPVFDSTLEGKGVPVLDVVASRDAAGKRLIIKAVNTSREQALSTRVSVTGVHVGSGGAVHTLTAPSLAAYNSFRTPDAVGVRSEAFQAGPSFTITLPPHSVSVLVLPIAER
ncbi:MAG TPA: alpha-L-arabinofuranosidase C-terminal domain-containing protein [Vicinamibacterales bacterium]|nr:alpha-L-arabinofuranosidase C-terminal domain-containing protein [Vicinamibacterales bacterium]